MVDNVYNRTTYKINTYHQYSIMKLINETHSYLRIHTVQYLPIIPALRQLRSVLLNPGVGQPDGLEGPFLALSTS